MRTGAVGLSQSPSQYLERSKLMQRSQHATNGAARASSMLQTRGSSRKVVVESNPWPIPLPAGEQKIYLEQSH